MAGIKRADNVILSVLNVCSIKTFYINNCCPSKLACESNALQNKPTNHSNIRHRYLIYTNNIFLGIIGRTNHVCLVNPSLLAQNVFSIFTFLLNVLSVLYLEHK